MDFPDVKENIINNGEVVFHKIFGKGTIISYDKSRDSYLVNFEGKGKRNVLSGFLKRTFGLPSPGPNKKFGKKRINIIQQKLQLLNNVNQTSIELHMGDYVMDKAHGYGRVVELRENSCLVHFFESNQAEEVEKAKGLKFIISSEVDVFYRTSRREPSYFYLKEIKENNDSAYFCGVYSHLGVFCEESLYTVEIQKMSKCTEEEFKEHCPEWEQFCEYRSSKDN